MIRRLILALTAFLLMAGAARAEAPGLSVALSAETVRPGKAVVITVRLPEDGLFSLLLEDENGIVVSAAAENREGRAGENIFYWNGTRNGVAAPAGEYRMVLEAAGGQAETRVTVGAMAPTLIGAAAEKAEAERGDRVSVSFFATEAGTLRALFRSTEGELRLPEIQIGRGEEEVELEAAAPAGDFELIMTLTAEDGTESDPVSLPFRILPRRERWGYTPLADSPQDCLDELNYWTLPMDITDEKGIWEALTAPVTVVDPGEPYNEKSQVLLRSEPDEKSMGVGEVTCVSQGVYVLEKGEEWTLVACYSSSFHDSETGNWNGLVQGWLPTAWLKEVTPNQEMGIVVDKLTQRMHVFMDGQLYATLLVSTGLANRRQPYNETRSGEYLLVSKVGGFRSDNMVCPLALRFNAGDMIHEVPYVRRENEETHAVTQIYSVTEPRLGTKASHGCIRVQMKPTPEGVNQEWLWKHYQKNTKVMIWEDWQGRQIPEPAGDTVLYWNPKAGSGSAYHSADHCPGDSRTLQAFYYSQLDEGNFAKLKPCLWCAPPLRTEKIAEINAQYAPGGDHDPVLTEARQKSLQKMQQKTVQRQK